MESQTSAERSGLKYLLDGKINNYRAPYVITRLLEQALQRGYLPEFGARPEEKLYFSARRKAKWARRFVNLTTVGGLVGLNLLYLLPRYSKFGLATTLLVNSAFLGVSYAMPQIYLSNLDLEFIDIARQCSKRYANDLVDMLRKGRLLYRFEPAYADFPPDPSFAYKSYLTEVNDLWRKAHKFDESLWGELHGHDARYATTSGMSDWRTAEDNNPRVHRGYGRDSAA
jgi:hypothetical protein